MENHEKTIPKIGATSARWLSPLRFQQRHGTSSVGLEPSTAPAAVEEAGAMVPGGSTETWGLGNPRVGTVANHELLVEFAMEIIYEDLGTLMGSYWSLNSHASRASQLLDEENI